MNTSIDQEKPTDYSKNQESEKLWNVNFAISHLSKNHTTTDTLEEKPKKNSLFIGDLSIFCEEQDLKYEFSSFGEIEDIKIMRSQETKRNLCYGFIRFTDPESAQKAMEKMNGKILHGRPLRVNFASFKPKSRETRESAQGKGESSAVHVSFISYQTKVLVTEETLRNVFTQFGKVLDVSIKKSTIEEAINCQSGYGFVHFDVTPAGVEAAVRAVKELNDVQVEDVNYKCNVSHNLNKRLNNSNIRGNVSTASTKPTANSTNEDRSREFERPILEEQVPFPRYDHTYLGPSRRPCDIPPVGGRRPYPQGPPDIHHTRVPDDHYYDTYYDDYAWESRDVRDPYFRHKSDRYYRNPIARDRYPRDFYADRDPRFDPRDPYYRGDPYWREREARASYTYGPPRENPPSAYAYDDYPYAYSRRGECLPPREYLYSRDRYYEDYYDGPAYPPPPRAYPPVDPLEAYTRNRGPLVPPPVYRDVRNPRGLRSEARDGPFPPFIRYAPEKKPENPEDGNDTISITTRNSKSNLNKAANVWIPHDTGGSIETVPNEGLLSGIDEDLETSIDALKPKKPALTSGDTGLFSSYYENQGGNRARNNENCLLPPPELRTRFSNLSLALKTNVDGAVEENDGYTYDTEDEQQVCSFDFLQTPQSPEVQETVGTETLQPKNIIYPGQERDYCPGSKVTSQERGGDIRWSAASGNQEVGNPLGYPSVVPNYAYSKKYPPRYESGADGVEIEHIVSRGGEKRSGSSRGSATNFLGRLNQHID